MPSYATSITPIVGDASLKSLQYELGHSLGLRYSHHTRLSYNTLVGIFSESITHWQDSAIVAVRFTVVMA